LGFPLFEFFVGDIRTGVGLGYFGLSHQALGPTTRGKFLFPFWKKQAKIRMFRAYDWPF